MTLIHAFAILLMVKFQVMFFGLSSKTLEANEWYGKSHDALRSIVEHRLSPRPSRPATVPLQISAFEDMWSKNRHIKQTYSMCIAGILRLRALMAHTRIYRPTLSLQPIHQSQHQPSGLHRLPAFGFPWIPVEPVLIHTRQDLGMLLNRDNTGETGDYILVHSWRNCSRISIMPSWPPNSVQPPRPRQAEETKLCNHYRYGVLTINKP